MINLCEQCGVTELPSSRRLCDVCIHENGKAAKRRWAKENKARINEWKTSNIEKVREYHREWNKRNYEKILQDLLSWQAANPEKVRVYQEKGRGKRNSRATARRKELSDGYVAHTLRMNVNDVPKELLEAKRIQLQIKRYLKERT